MATPTFFHPLRTPLVCRGFRAYFAPVNRVLQQPTVFDPSTHAGFSFSAPPSPWVDLGWVENLDRQAQSKVEAVATGLPPVATSQVRLSLGATLSLRFQNWSKLTMALAAGAEHWNVLLGVAGSTPNGSGSRAVPAVGIMPGSTASELNLSSVSAFSVGSVLAVDIDYTGQTGFIGSGLSAAYVQSTSQISSDSDHIRRLTFNIARVSSVTGNAVQLSTPLIAGTPTSAMKVQEVVAYTDREGGSFFQEWSALFVTQGEQGDRLIIHYPRLQSASSPNEAFSPLGGDLQVCGPAATFRAMPVIDTNDQKQILCYRTYLPNPNAPA